MDGCSQTARLEIDLIAWLKSRLSLRSSFYKVLLSNTSSRVEIIEKFL